MLKQLGASCIIQARAFCGDQGRRGKLRAPISNLQALTSCKVRYIHQPITVPKTYPPSHTFSTNQNIEQTNPSLFDQYHPAGTCLRIHHNGPTPPALDRLDNLNIPDKARTRARQHVRLPRQDNPSRAQRLREVLPTPPLRELLLADPLLTNDRC